MISGDEGEVVTINLDKTGLITEIRDELGRSLAFAYNDHREVSRVSGWKGSDAVYHYNDKDELVEAQTQGGGQRSYRYDDRHAMTLFQEGKDNPEVVSYFDGRQQFRVKSVAGSGGSLSAYSYQVDRADPLQYGTRIVTTERGEAGEEQETTVTYQYQERSGKGNSNWLEKKVIDYGYQKKETLYSERRTPLAITVDGDRTSFRYDGKGRLQAKERANGEVTELEYDPVADKVSRVRSYNRSDLGRFTETKYRYDEQGNLVSARDGAGRSVTMTYDAARKIGSMVVGTRTLSFTYGKSGKPVRIEVAGLGALVVTYDDAGEIASTEAEGVGSRLALVVTDAFSTMLELVSAAKVSLDER